MILPRRIALALLPLAVVGCGGEGGDDPVQDAGPFCAGEAVACEDVPVEECTAQLGCRTETGCVQTSERPRCEDLVGVFDCTSTLRCEFDVASMTCSGTVFECSVQTLENPCNGEVGCSWGSRCVGDVVSCEELTEGAECAFQSGCAENP